MLHCLGRFPDSSRKEQTVSFSDQLCAYISSLCRPFFWEILAKIMLPEGDHSVSSHLDNISDRATSIHKQSVLRSCQGGYFMYDQLKNSPSGSARQSWSGGTSLVDSYDTQIRRSSTACGISTVISQTNLSLSCFLSEGLQLAQCKYKGLRQFSVTGSKGFYHILITTI